MISPRIDALLDNVDSRYALVIVAAKRARQINNYHHQLGEGTFDELPPSSSPLEELSDDGIRGDRRGQDRVRVPEELVVPRVVGGADGTKVWPWLVLLGVSGGIAAYKACELCRLLVREGHDVTPLLTPEAETFVSAKTFEALARRETPRDLYPHLVEADLFVIAPLTANTLAKLAHGLADGLLAQAALAYRGPVLAAPAMNVRMWEHPATQANVRLLAERGVELIGPAEGELAEGETGLGRMSEPEEIFARCSVILGKAGRLSGKQVLVSAGGTREPLDAVRYLGNRSSGRMGVALAEEARRRGADVTLLAANLAVQPPSDVTVVETATAAELAEEAFARPESDVVLMAAAVADYRPRMPSPASARKTVTAGRSSSSPRRMFSPSWANGGRMARCSSALRPTTARRASTVRARSSPRRQSTSSSSMTSRATTSASTPRRTRW